MLGVAIHKGVSFPVGKVDTLELNPLSFREFLLAVGEDGLVQLIDEMNIPLLEAFRDKYVDWLKKYYFIGGMPEIVASFIEDKDFSEVRRPLKAYTEFSAFKLYLLDVGLLAAMSELDAKTILEGNAIFVEFKGALDFLIQKGQNIVLIEVKAEENLRAKSLKVYCDKYQPEVAIRTSMSNYREQDWMVNMPLWTVSKF